MPFTPTKLSNPDRGCQDLALLNEEAKPECEGDFGRNVWLEPFLWASNALNQTTCPLQSDPSDGSYMLRSWYPSAGTKDAYNNFTTLIEPIIVTLLQARHESQERSVWAKSHLMCLRTGKNVSEGSAPSPKEVPQSSLSNRVPENRYLWVLGLLIVAII
ncbi:hypothetical protein CC80DRAFT_544134 [Byssothecium circinans]|uniref:Uncharacterized protein n=1 Tax=Byssothecium circinans TaxID=147558 RepID=A0A6A5U7R4_9PLEO|nr:hypothetical protein CC80DRAFT_544134 [Byssothecium circinans]